MTISRHTQVDIRCSSEDWKGQALQRTIGLGKRTGFEPLMDLRYMGRYPVHVAPPGPARLPYCRWYSRRCQIGSSSETQYSHHPPDRQASCGSGLSSMSSHAWSLGCPLEACAERIGLLRWHIRKPIMFIACSRRASGRRSFRSCCRMGYTSRDQKLFSDCRVINLPSDLEFHLAFQDDDRFVGRMREILPPPSRWVDPEIATEPPRRPIGGNLFLVDA